MKLLITGGCGFLGSNLAADALGRSIQLTVFDNLSRQGAAHNLAWLHQQGDFEFFHGDIRSETDVQTVLKASQPDLIFHLAGQVAMTTSLSRPRYDFEVNALGTLNVLEAMRASAPDATVIYSSTNKVYGDLEWVSYLETETRYQAERYPNGFDEETRLDFHSPYGTSKGSADQYMLDYARMFGLKTAVFRHSSMFGGRQFSTSDQGWIGWFCKCALDQSQGSNTASFSISGTGKQVRDVLFVDDMVRLYYAAASQIDRVKGQAFNVGGGMANSLSLLELFQMLESKLNIELNYHRLAPRQSDQKVFVADIGKARRLLGWEPMVSASEGVDRMLQWVRTAK